MARPGVGRLNLPHASVMLRMVAFAVPAGLAIAGVQPLLASLAGSVAMSWAIGLSVPALGAAAVVFGAGRMSDRGDAAQPPWYTAWLLLPGAFLLAGAAAMCVFGALVELPMIRWTMLGLVVSGGVLWLGAMVLVRSYSH